MLTQKTKEILSKTFQKTLYEYKKIPDYEFGKNNKPYGIYLHVPFCKSFCDFCPFYKVKFNENKKNSYLKSILKEIELKKIEGKPNWMYIGGGTPNSLKTEEIKTIIEKIKTKVNKLDNIGLELLPAMLNEKYLEDLKSIGINKISLGIESFSNYLMKNQNRIIDSFKHIQKMIKVAKSLDLWISMDTMVGFQNQNEKLFQNDIEKVIELNPNQVTIYPVMKIKRTRLSGYLNDIDTFQESKQFDLINNAYKTLKQYGFSRKTIWTFGRDSQIYDSSGDELVNDYVGFGPAGFSTFGEYKVVNPEFDIYIKNIENEKLMGLVANQSKASNEWRKFAKMIYECECKNSKDFPFYINGFISLLKMCGYVKKGKLTDKGIHFSHSITKSVVESLPFPIQNTQTIINLEDYNKEKL